MAYAVADAAGEGNLMTRTMLWRRGALGAVTVGALAAGTLGLAPLATAAPTITVDRISGANRVETAVEASKALFDDVGGLNTASVSASIEFRRHPSRLIWPRLGLRRRCWPE